MPRNPRPPKPTAPAPTPGTPRRFQIWIHRVDEPAADGDGPRAKIVITLLIGGALAT